MSSRNLFFALLCCSAGALHAQSASKPCSAPTLTDGYFRPKRASFSHGSQLSYTCAAERKPVVESWWATVTCEDGSWSHEPRCIEKEACIPPVIPNAGYTRSQDGWYKQGHKIRIRCDPGYEHKLWTATALCVNGSWSTLPVCGKRDDACGMPPQIAHAIVINQKPQEVFAADSVVQYECEDGFTVEGDNSSLSVLCLAGSWEDGPTCIKDTRPPSAGPDGSTTAAETASSTGSAEKDTSPVMIPVRQCGREPNHGFAYVEQRTVVSLKYRCIDHTEPVSFATVVCYSDKTWSKLPVCRGTCVLDPDDHIDVRIPGNQFLWEDQQIPFLCVQEDHVSLFRCVNGRITRTQSQSASKPCSAPTLTDGYFRPKRATFSHGSQLSYTCAAERKPVVESWWATATCEDGSWSHEPRCIEKEACIPPVIPNAGYTRSQDGWYKQEHKIRIRCNPGYEHKLWTATALCVNGSWSTLPVCGKRDDACGMPPQIAHAIVINQKPQEVFAADSVVQYECEDGFTVEGDNSSLSVLCLAGSWDDGPTCIKDTRPPSAGPDGSTTAAETASSTGSAEKDTSPVMIPVRQCGREPNHGFAYVEQRTVVSLKYRCIDHTEPVSFATVVCYSDKTWSKLPVCRGTCVLDPDDHKDVRIPGNQFLWEDQQIPFLCVQEDHVSLFRCVNGRITRTQCCHQDVRYVSVTE
ncbi:uncharacterized protein V6R79_016378 [Siganus canaliculatus]